ncbi:MAG: FtsL-like putative cell division protein [Flavobacteriia bacterium]|nr:FtsL-like putative cell division protein [Flavobacteriia bacterium]
MKKSLLSILKGSFLIGDDAPKHWRFFIYIAVLGAVMISAAHEAESKVYEIARLSEQVKALKNEYVGLRSGLQQAQLESNIVNKVVDLGLFPPETPALNIIVTTNLKKQPPLGE